MREGQDYAGVFKNKTGSEIWVYVGKKSQFPSLDICEYLQRVDLGEKNLKEVYEDSQKEGVLFGCLVCHPSCVTPPEQWEAINMMTSVSSVEEVIESAQKYFAKYAQKPEAEKIESS